MMQIVSLRSFNGIGPVVLTIIPTKSKFLNFYFEIIVDLQEVTEIIRKSSFAGQFSMV